MIGLDQRVERWVVHHRTEPFDSFFVALSHLGSYGIVWLTLAVLTVWLSRRPVAFPLASFACAATLAPFVPRGAAPVLYVLAAAIAYSRVYVGVHYPLDVLAGAALGLLFATALRLLPAALRRSRPEQRAS